MKLSTIRIAMICILCERLDVALGFTSTSILAKLYTPSISKLIAGKHLQINPELREIFTSVYELMKIDNEDIENNETLYDEIFDI